MEDLDVLDTADSESTGVGGDGVCPRELAIIRIVLSLLDGTKQTGRTPLVVLVLVVIVLILIIGPVANPDGVPLLASGL